jgi:SAM-dependent methyltransferase
MTSSLGYTDWMREYISRSNEKTLSQQIFVGIIKALNTYQKPVGTHIVDIGCGDGSRVKDFVTFVADCNPGKMVTYTGIDADAAAIAFAKTTFDHIPGVQAQLYQRDSFQEGVPEGTADLIVVSHAAYFAGERLPTFIKNVMQGLTKNGIALFLHDRHGAKSDINAFYGKYNPTFCDPNISKKIETELNNLDIKYTTIEFTATLQLPTIPEDLWENIAVSPLMPVSDANDQIGVIFSLLSFAAQCSLIELKEKGTLQKFLQEIKALLATQNHQLNVGNNCHIAIAKDHDPDFLSIINHIAPFPKGDDSHLATHNAADAATA